jgi:hypothetical protein
MKINQFVHRDCIQDGGRQWSDSTYSTDCGEITVQVTQHCCYNSQTDIHEDYRPPSCTIETRDRNGDRDTVDIRPEHAEILIEALQRFLQLSRLYQPTAQ